MIDIVECLNCKHNPDMSAKQREIIRAEAYQQGKADAIDEFVNFCINDWKMAKAVVITEEETNCFRFGGCMARLLEQFKDEYTEKLKEQKNV